MWLSSYSKPWIKGKKLTELLTYLTTLPDDSELSLATLATTLRLILILPATPHCAQITSCIEKPKGRARCTATNLPESLGDGSRRRWPERLLLPHGARAAAGWTAARAQATMAAQRWESLQNEMELWGYSRRRMMCACVSLNWTEEPSSAPDVNTGSSLDH